MHHLPQYGKKQLSLAEQVSFMVAESLVGEWKPWEDWVVHPPCQASKDVLDVGVVPAWLGDGDAQLCVAQSSDGCDDTRDDPDDQREAHWAGVLQHTLGTDEDTWANDVTWENIGRKIQHIKNTNFFTLKQLVM